MLTALFILFVTTCELGAPVLAPSQQYGPSYSFNYGQCMVSGCGGDCVSAGYRRTYAMSFQSRKELEVTLASTSFPEGSLVLDVKAGKMLKLEQKPKVVKVKVEQEKVDGYTVELK